MLSSNPRVKKIVTKRQLVNRIEHEPSAGQQARITIQNLWANGFTRKQIITKGYSSYMVKRWVQAYLANNHKLVSVAKEKSGRKHKILDEMARDLVRWNEEGNKTDNPPGLRRLAAQISDKYSAQMPKDCKGNPWRLSREAVRNFFLATGLRSRATGHQPHITKDHATKRVAMAVELKDFDWSKAVFVDETYAQDHGRTNGHNDRRWTVNRTQYRGRRTTVSHPAQIGYFSAVCIHGVLPLYELFRDTKPTVIEAAGKREKRQEAKKQKEQQKVEKQTALLLLGKTKPERKKRRTHEQVLADNAEKKRLKDEQLQGGVKGIESKLVTHNPIAESKKVDGGSIETTITKPKRKRRTNAQIAMDKQKPVEASTTTKPKRKRRTKQQIATDNAEKLKQLKLDQKEGRHEELIGIKEDSKRVALSPITDCQAKPRRKRRTKEQIKVDNDRKTAEKAQKETGLKTKMAPEEEIKMTPEQEEEQRMNKAGWVRKKKKNPQRTNAKMYIEKCLIPLVRDLKTFFPKDDYTLFQDRAPYHNAKMVQQWLKDNKVEIYHNWPGNSPDLNPQENCWAIAKDRCYRQVCSNLQEVDSSFHAAYQSISKEVCEKMMRGMVGRLESVIRLEGAYIGK